MKVMVVDDSRVMRDLLKTLIARFAKDAEIIEAENGSVALYMLNANDDVNLVFADWNMPILDGFGFVKSVRESEKFNDIKIVMITSETDKKKITEIANLGVNGYIFKPFKPEHIEQVLIKYAV